MNEKFAAELDRLMRQHEPRFSIKTLADELGLTYEFVRKLVRGSNLPSPGTMINMARLFGVEVSELEELVKEDQFAATFGREIASILFNPETKALVLGLNQLDNIGKKQVLGLLDKLLRETNSQHASA